MIKEIDGLKLPRSIDATPVLNNRDNVRQTVSGRLVTELDPNPKWEVPASFSSFVLGLDLQRAFYEKCFAMRITPAPVTFISPYNGEEVTVQMKCTEINAPKALGISSKTKTPSLYRDVRAVFREV